MADWAVARKEDESLLSEWQVYRLLDVPSGAWTAFQYLVRAARLLAEPPEDGVRLPGSRRDALAARAASDGVEIPDALHQRLLALAA